MQRPSIETYEVKTPSGITVNLKRRLTHGDEKAIQLAGIGSINLGDGEQPKVTAEQAYRMADERLLRSIASWDLVEEDGKPIPVTQEEIDACLTEEDTNFLIRQLDDGSDKKKS